VHANVLYPISWIALLFHYKFKLPFVLTEHWTAYMPEYPNKIKSFQLLLTKIAARKAEKIMVVSADLQKAMQNHKIKGKYEIIYNVVDDYFFNQNVEKNYNNKTRFIHISSLNDAQKNVSGIIKAVYQLSLIRNDFELCIIADGDATPFVQMSKELGVYQTYVHFEGIMTSEEIAFSLQNADCLLMFSNFESFSVVIAEALACGIPVIATKAGGLANELSEGKGIFIAPKDDGALLAAMIKMIDHHQDFDKIKLAEFATRFSSENVGKSFLKIYNKIINNSAQ
jgi:glycosyltransferase involved in cell wall biosynthesis